MSVALIGDTREFNTTVLGQPLLARRKGRGWSVSWEGETATGRSLIELVQRVVGNKTPALRLALATLLEEMDSPTARPQGDQSTTGEGGASDRK